MNEPGAGRLERELANLRAETQGLQKRLSILSQVSGKITESLDLDIVLHEVVDAACLLADARYGALGVFDGSGKVEQFITHGITDEERRRLGNIPQGFGILGYLQHVQQPLRLADLAKHPRSVGFPANHPPMTTFLGAPIRLGDEALGNLYLTEKKDGKEFTPEDEQVLVLFAAQAALALHNARRFQAEKVARREAEEATKRSQRAEQEAAAERKRLRALLDISPIGIFVADRDGNVLVLNPEARRIVGLKPDAAHYLDRSTRAFSRRTANGEAFEPEELPIQRALTRGETTRAEEIVYEFPDGSKIPTLVSAAPILSEDGSIEAAVGTIQDITSLEELERMRNEFLGMVSHELRTPLTAIKGSAATVLGSRLKVQSWPH